MPNMTNKEYVAKCGNECPFCGGSEIQSSSPEFDGSSCWREAQCDSCGAEWQDIYELVGYEVAE